MYKWLTNKKVSASSNTLIVKANVSFTETASMRNRADCASNSA